MARITRQEFLKRAWAAAKASSEKSGLPPAVTVAQAAIESNWGNSRLSRDANNYFGIKAHGKHPVVEFSTCEFLDGDKVTVKARFAKYESMQECFECRDRMILNSGTYAEAKACCADEVAFISAIAKHWATDPKYAEKITGAWRELMQEA